MSASRIVFGGRARDRLLHGIDIAGRAVYLALCKTPDDRLRLKPQNLLVNLPLAERA